VKPARFRYHRPEETDEVVALLAELGDEAKVLAGGQSLVPLLSMRLARVEHLIDVNRVDDLSRMTVDDNGATIGAMTRQSTVEHSAQVASSVPLLAMAVPHIGHFQIRNRGTIGGSIAHADPASELPAVALALDAEVDARSTRGQRSIPARELFVGTWTTSLAADEVLQAVRFPAWRGRCGFALEEFARRKGDFAIAGAACAVRVDDRDQVDRASIVLMGMSATPVRAGEAERLLIGTTPDEDALAQAGRVAADASQPSDDIHGPADYRRRVAAHMVTLALRASLRQAMDHGRN
jgi:aerobic carbon-monoxide dehydrogenase medium subunit